MRTQSSDWLGSDLLSGLQCCNENLYFGSEAGVATVRTGSVGGIPPLLELLLQLSPSWSAGSTDAVAEEGLVVGLSWCG